jgi:hypothetical protein
MGVAKLHHEPGWMASEDTSGMWPNAVEHLHTLSVVMHSFAPLEGHVNRVAYAMLRESGSRHYVIPEKRTYEFRELVAKWDGPLAIDKKVEFLFGHVGSPLGMDVLSRVRELALLRNWIAHGKVYSTELLIERSGDEFGGGAIHARVDGQTWHPKFPNYKFPMPDQLSYRDRRSLWLAVARSSAHSVALAISRFF